MGAMQQMMMGTAGAVVKKTLLEIITEASLTTNLKLCLDAGDMASWPGSGTKWLDRSSGGYDFFLGTNGSTAAPTFNGTPGDKTASEYWTGNGCYFNYDSTNEAWMQAMAKDGATFSYLVIARDTAASDLPFFGNKLQVPNYEGQWSLLRSSGALGMLTDSNSWNNSSSVCYVADWQMYAGSMAEDQGAVSFFYCDGAYAQYAGANTFTLHFGNPGGDSSAGMQVAGGGSTTRDHPVLTNARRRRTAGPRGTGVTPCVDRRVTNFREGVQQNLRFSRACPRLAVESACSPKTPGARLVRPEAMSKGGLS